MSYRPIALLPNTSAEVEVIVRRRIDMFCADLHAMFRLPLPVLGVTAACNFAIAEVLCSLISGISRVFMDPTSGSAQAFRAVLAFYPTEKLPLAVSKEDLIEQLYKTYRCNFAHSLGINVPDPAKRGQPRTIEPLTRRTKILRLQHSMLPTEIPKRSGSR